MREKLKESLKKPKKFAEGVSFYKLVWIFVIFSIFGTYFEQIIVLVQNIWGGNGFYWEPRQGVLYGPLSPIYGVGAVLMVIALKGFRDFKPWQTFLLSGIIGGVFEVLASYIQEIFTGTRSWYYYDHWLNFDGRTSLFVMLVWGLLGVILIYILYPLISRLVERLPLKTGKIVTWILIVVVGLDILVSYTALIRQDLRRHDVPARTFVGEFCDKYYTDEYLHEKIPNMTWLTTNASYDLSTLTENLQIVDGGTYTLSGEMKEGLSVVVKSDVAVEIVLNGATVNATNGAAIAQTGNGALTIKIAENTENNLSDGGESEQDACIYSESALTINGENGILRVTGQQKEGEGIATEAADMTINGGVIYVDSADDGLNAGGDGGTITINGGELYINAGGDGIDSNKNAVFNGGKVYVAGSNTGGDAGIDTDDGYVVNGGLIVALGSDMLESPESNSSQYVVAMTLGTTYPSGAEVDLEDSEGVAVISFDAMENFRTLVLSSDQLTTGTYTLKVNGTAVQAVTITDKVTTVGSTMGGPRR